jgi:transposase-like protein
VIAHQAVLIAIGINWEGQRQVLAVEMANRESQSSWKEFLLRLKERGLSGVEFVFLMTTPDSRRRSLRY